jgi:hypothetical protein
MSEVKRTERGCDGHFICSHACLFRRNTLLTKWDVRIVVSTAGNMLDPLANNKYRWIGLDRYYETMVFHASYDVVFWDADSQRAIDEPGMDLMSNYHHEDVFNEIASRMEAGEFS